MAKEVPLLSIVITRLSNKLRPIISQMHIRNILTPQSILKIIFMYSVILSITIFCHFDYSPTIWAPKERTVAFYGVLNRFGEYQAYLRMQRAAKSLNWNYIGCAFDERLMNYFIFRHFYEVAAAITSYIFKPEANIAVTHYVTIKPPGYNMMYLNVPDVMLYSLEGEFLGKHMRDYDAYIDLYSLYNKDNKTLKKVLAKHKNERAAIIPAYLAQNSEPFSHPEKYDKMVIMGSLWGCNRGSYRVRELLRYLEEAGILAAYGPSYDLGYLNFAYMGAVEKYGIPTDTIITLNKNGGMALVIHNLEHLVAGIPTSRFAEALVSGAVVISDNHPFLKKYFGNNMLYFDSFKSADEMYSQIASHVDWVREHPKNARKMTEKAYDIFVKELSLEVQLERVMREVDAKI